MDAFDRFAPFIQDFIYDHAWEELRGIQVAAADILFNTNDNLLLCASTASGKTEAAFFPILTEFWEHPPQSVGAIYISPLKALINDQFQRLDTLCKEAQIPIWPWHGDIAASRKAKLLKKPSGILQITPESLEAMLLHRHTLVPRMFWDLRYVVIDEVHALFRGDRGGQTLCLLERLARAANVNPRRIGLSATIGDPEITAAFLARGTGHPCRIPSIEEPRRTWRLSMEHFYRGVQQVSIEQSASAETSAVPPRYQEEPQGTIDTSQFANNNVSSTYPQLDELLMRAHTTQTSALALQLHDHSEPASQPAENSTNMLHREMCFATKSDELVLSHANPADTSGIDQAIQYLFERSQGSKCLIFSNSREEAEEICSLLRSYAELLHVPDRFLIHHGNLSSSIRSSAEEIMRDEERLDTTITTATLELGIDIGRLERAFQIDAPFTVSGFLQRMGRTGRRGSPQEMHFVIHEEFPEAHASLPELIPWKLLQGIALIQLYRETRWVEPPRLDVLPYSLLYHQLMSTLASTGELSPAELAERILTLSFFHRVSAEDLKQLLLHLIDINHVEHTETGGLIVGLEGERIIQSYTFYAVFQENEEFSVRSELGELGTIVNPPPPGERIAIAGRCWVVDDIDWKRHVLWCTQVKGRVPAYFGDCAGDVHSAILERMHKVVAECEIYPYLQKRALARLTAARKTAELSHITGPHAQPLISLGSNRWALFPWLGSYSFLALERLIKLGTQDKLGIKGFESARPYYMQFTMRDDIDEQSFYTHLYEACEQLTEPEALLYPGETPMFNKYDTYLPASLLRKGFAQGVLDIDGMKEQVLSWYACYVKQVEPLIEE
ncbi:DEAD/DEAH box helicase [Collinsella sp. zg1085]|uniref:DEAD/DEAH box helicase n=1 Tax=Collinsella sp. zg1085 TaxID=2844380 RepID=UPI001C0E2603|nr:DEAD/DEAH box helicase [Collinsella sp. zg1085]QWT17240.1 DEAD/DEAH box helicase [Collinsella sp. zg1085]